jgi:hypothetical protein
LWSGLGVYPHGMNTATEVRDNKAVQILGRLGMVCYGVVHVLVAWLAVQVVFGDAEQADQKGAIGTLAESSVGPVLLWALGIGLLAYALWQLVLITTGYGWIPKKRKRIFRKIGAGARGAIGATLGIYAIGLANGGGSKSGTTQSQEWTARVMSLPAGQVLVGIAALVIIGIGVASIRKGIKHKFMEDLNRPQLPRVAEPLGVAGYCAKGVAYGVIGILVGIAAINHNPGDAGGLDVALKTLQQQTFGSILLFAVAIGLAAFGVYCFTAARAHKG